MTAQAFTRLMPLADVPIEGTARANIGRYSVLVCRTEDGVFVVQDKCSHMGLPLDGGRLRGHCLSCPEHGAEFDVRNGDCLAGPATRPIRTFDSRVVAGFIEAALEPRPGPSAFRPTGI